MGKARPLVLILVAAVAAVVVAVVAAVVVAVVVAMAVALCFGVRGLGVGMASKWIGHSPLTFGTRIVFVSLMCRRNSSVSHRYSGLYCFRSAKVMRLILMEGVCRTFFMRSPFGSSTVPNPLIVCNFLSPV